MDAATAEKKMQRMAYEIIENNIDATELILIGILDHGYILAKNIQKILSEISAIKTVCLSLSIDKKNPGNVTLSESMDFNQTSIILIDDVSNSGKSILYALKPLLDFHPEKIQTLVLVERTHKAFPINSDFVGLSLATTLQEHIFVEVEGEQIKGAYLQ